MIALDSMQKTSFFGKFLADLHEDVAPFLNAQDKKTLHLWGVDFLLTS
jgi:hypothetical protein